ncbi:MAG: PduL/EutD family phosphate acyltransferase, partial [Acutalibacteraceae bacterium]
AQNHIHMTPADAERYSLKDSQSVKVRINTARPVTFDNVIVRVSPKFSLAMHIDFDEANACCLDKDSTGIISL